MALQDELRNRIQQSYDTDRQKRSEFEQQRTDTQNRLKSEYDISGREKTAENLRRNIFDTEKLLRKLPGNVTARTRGRLITDAQRNRILASEQAPVTQQLSDLSMARGVEEEGLGRAQQSIASSLADLLGGYDRRRQGEGEERSYWISQLGEEAANQRASSANALQERIANIQAQAARDQLEFQKRLNEINQPITPEGIVDAPGAMAFEGIGQGLTGIPGIKGYQSQGEQNLMTQLRNRIAQQNRNRGATNNLITQGASYIR